MTTLKTGLKFEDAARVAEGGGFVRLPPWHFRDSNGNVFPTALTKVKGVFLVVVAPDKGLHRWEPTVPEIASVDWECVEF